MDLDLSTYQAKAGYAVLQEYRDEYLPMIWLTEIEERWEAGEDFEDVVADILRAACPWYAKAARSNYPVGLRMFEGVEWFIQACEAELPEPSGRLSHGSGGT